MKRNLNFTEEGDNNIVVSSPNPNTNNYRSTQYVSFVERTDEKFSLGEEQVITPRVRSIEYSNRSTTTPVPNATRESPGLVYVTNNERNPLVYTKDAIDILLEELVKTFLNLNQDQQGETGGTAKFDFTNEQDGAVLAYNPDTNKYRPVKEVYNLVADGGFF